MRLGFEEQSRRLCVGVSHLENVGSAVRRLRRPDPGERRFTPEQPHQQKTTDLCLSCTAEPICRRAPAAPPRARSGLSVGFRRRVTSRRVARFLRLHPSGVIVYITRRIRARSIPSTTSASPASACHVADFGTYECFDRFGGRLSRRPGLLTAQVLVGQLDEYVEIALRVVAADNPTELAADLERFDGREWLRTPDGLLRQGHERRATGGVLSENGDTQDKRDGQRRPGR
jgi:hypothetical protein